jgi:opacity protein-like surface antigen
MRPPVISALASLMLSVVLSQSAVAADLGTSEPEPAVDTTHPFFRHRLMLQAGAAFNHLATTAQVGRADATGGTVFSLEDDLRFDSEKVSLDILARLRLGERWSMELSYFDASRSSTANISREIEFGRLTFPVNATVSADFGLTAYRLGLGYAFHQTKATEIGLALSLYVHDFDVAARGMATLPGFGASFQSENYSVVAPLPTIGLFAHHALTSKWLVSGSVDWIDLSLDSVNVVGIHVGDLSGRLLSVEIGTEYRLFESLAVGAAYRYQDVSFGAVVSNLRGRLEYTTSAPMAFVRTGF